jgi:hypothetical protein
VGKRLVTFEARNSAGAARIELGVTVDAFIEIVLHLFQDLPVERRGACVIPSLLMHLKLSRHSSREILLEITAGTQERAAQQNGDAAYDGEESFVSHNLSSLMTVTAESKSTHTIRAGIPVGMARVADGAGIAVPIPVLARHESSRMRLRVCPLDAVRIHVTCDAGRIGPLRIMAGGAALDVAPCERCVHTTSATDADRYESRLQVGLRLELGLVYIPAGGMAG